ncbi:DUF885 domain-containing protein [Streptomyces viridochromogenes]|uniref:DUF885 domain-containing protein n=1 Tax=Streptomyces viridochromogenes TaxID=1938 RepID=UPI00031C6DFF|nr:DUF885 domain-containing protein [Streptomyces viridochromogenes]
MPCEATGVHGVCDAYVDDYARLNPLAATEFGILGHDDRLPDLSPDGHAARAGLARAALAAMAAAQPVDEGERIAKAVFSERLQVDVDMHEAGLPAASLNMTASPAQDIRYAFDLMPTETAEDWAVIAKRLARVPEALAGYRASLSASADEGVVSAVRQVRRTAQQCETWSGAGSFFATLAASAEGVPGVDGALRADLDAGVRAAREAYAELAAFLRDALAPKAGDEDAVGEDLYKLWSRKFTGADMDLRDAYAWGWAEFGRIEAELTEVAGRIRPGAGPAEAAETLDGDPRYRVTGRAAFQAWMQELSERALAELHGTHFDIPAELMRLDCRIAPPGGGLGAYYTNPADDFSRPGTMWWSLPEGRREFPTWREASTVYHEGVPGHHLQIGTAVVTKTLNRFQRLLCFIDGHGEGWALYAERLMREFGYLDDGYLLGMLNKHLFRAARVIVDIGMHLKLEIPAGTGFHEGRRWTPELGREFLRTRTLTDEARAIDEIDRYLGWPGQATAYKLGERLWLSIRDETKAARGSEFALKDFHMRALRSGPAGLDTLREVLVRSEGTH